MMKKINKKLTSPYKANEKGKSHTDVFVVRAVCMHALSGRKTYKKNSIFNGIIIVIAIKAIKSKSFWRI